MGASHLRFILFPQVSTTFPIQSKRDFLLASSVRQASEPALVIGSVTAHAAPLAAGGSRTSAARSPLPVPLILGGSGGGQDKTGIVQIPHLQWSEVVCGRQHGEAELPLAGNPGAS